jgi:hypothetical protein
MMKRMMITLSMVVTIATPSFARIQGREANNGGDALETPTSVRFLDLVRIPSSVYLDLEDEGYIDALATRLHRHPGFAGTTYFSDLDVTMTMDAKILAALKSLKFYLVPGPIPESNDRGFVELPWNIRGKVKRLALQDANTRKVIVDRDLFAQLRKSPEDTHSFFMHEGLIRVYNDDAEIAMSFPLTNIEKIAALVNATFRSDRTRGLSPRSVATYLCEAKIPAGIGSYDGYTTIPGLFSTETSYPAQVVAFAMDADRCEAMKWRVVGPAQGEHHVNVVRPYEYLHIWKFMDQAEDGRESSLTLGLLGRWARGGGLEAAELEYNNNRSDAIGFVLPGANHATSILRLYSRP